MWALSQDSMPCAMQHYPGQLAYGDSELQDKSSSEEENQGLLVARGAMHGAAQNLQLKLLTRALVSRNRWVKQKQS